MIGKIDLDNLGAQHPPVEKKEEPAVVAKKEIEPEVKAEPKVEAPAPEPVVKPEPVTVPKEEVKPVTPQITESPAAETPVEDTTEPEVDEVIRAKAERLSGPNVVGKIQLPVNAPKRNQPVASSSNTNSAADHKRKRKRKDNQHGGGGHPGQQTGQQPSAPINPNRPDFRNRGANNAPGAGGANRPDFRNRTSTPGAPKEEPSEKEIQDQIKATLARLSGAGKSGKFAQRG